MRIRIRMTLKSSKTCFVRHGIAVINPYNASTVLDAKTFLGAVILSPARMRLTETSFFLSADTGVNWKTLYTR